MSKRNLAILAGIAAAFIYGINHTLAKGVMPFYIKPFGFIMLRVVGATILFWGISLFGPREKIERSDWLRLIFCAFCGMVMNMLSFFKGLDLSTPINSSVLITTTPIIVVVLSAILIKEKVGWRKAIGIGVGLVGALVLILYGQEVRQDAPNIPLGNSLFLVNALFYGLYLIVVKKLVDKYHPFTLMKWLFLVAIFINAPVALGEFLEVQWSELPVDVMLKMAFVVIGTTFMAYLLNIFALTQLKASTVSAFVYLQPVIGILFAIAMGQDALTTVKTGAAILVMVGVYLVSKRPTPGSEAA